MPREPAVPNSPLGWVRYMKGYFADMTPYVQTYATADKTHAARVAAAVVTSPAVTATPAGWASISQADSIITQLNNLRTDANDTAQVLNSLLDDLQLMGLVR